jgi:RimJ/RimL family protein N-acetyltransferase
MSELAGLFDTCAGAATVSLTGVLPRLLAHGATPEPAQRTALIELLHAHWSEHGAQLPPADLRALLALAAHWRDWPLTEAAAARLQGMDKLDNGEILHLIDACRALGKADRALDLARKLQAREPAEARHARLAEELRSWRDWRARFPSAGQFQWADEDLALEPLAHHHARDFAWQYYDPAIADLCCLPAFIDELDWHYWLADVWRAGARLPHAVLHREWGFVGCVSLAIHRDVGFFYYWLGRDFQGRGFGPRAGTLLLSLARRAYGLRCCYAKSFDYNGRSRRGLEKMGFAGLDIRGAGEDCNQLFYRRGPAQARRHVVDELHWLLERMDAQVRPAGQKRKPLPA